MRYRPRRSVIAVATLLVLIGLTGCDSSNNDTAGPAAPISAGASTAVVEPTPAPGNHERELSWDGRMRS